MYEAMLKRQKFCGSRNIPRSLPLNQRLDEPILGNNDLIERLSHINGRIRIYIPMEAAEE